MRKTVRVLVVEDERKEAAALKDGLEAEGYEVTVPHTGEDGFFLVSFQTFESEGDPSPTMGRSIWVGITVLF